jgi:hypothetical protein
MPCHTHTDDIPADITPVKLTADEVQYLADRLFSRGISSLSTECPRSKADLIAASRTLRALLRQYEHATGRQLQTVLLCGGL